MIPGKTYTPEAILQIAWRRKWFILIPAVLVSASAALWVRSLPDVYTSSSTILVVPQRVSEAYVRTATTMRLGDRLLAIQAQILSRSQLERIVEEFGLYSEERKTQILEDIIQKFRDQDIRVDETRGDMFTVSYRNSSARTAQKVTERLASLFKDESLRDREGQAESTNQFLEAQLEDKRRQLIDYEKKTQDYRRKYDGQLPDQLNANLTGLHNVEMELQAVTENLIRDRDRHRDLETRIAEAQSAEIPAAQLQANSSSAALLKRETEELAALQLKLKPEHPEIAAKKRRVAELQKRVEEEAGNSPVDQSSPGDALRRTKIDALRRELDDLNKQMASRIENERRLRANLSAYQARIEATPTRQAELGDMGREYPTVQTMFNSIAAKKEEAQIAANLERRQIGEQFKIVEVAQMPARPSSPDRPRYYMLSLLAGLAAGLALAGLFEYFDRAMRSEDDVRAALGLPVLAAIPLVTNASGAARRRTRMIAMSASAGAAILATAAVVAWKFLK